MKTMPWLQFMSWRDRAIGAALLGVATLAPAAAFKATLLVPAGDERLDRQAQEAVMRWRFVPGKRNGVPEAMWNLVPVNFVLE